MAHQLYYDWIAEFFWTGYGAFRELEKYECNTEVDSFSSEITRTWKRYERRPACSESRSNFFLRSSQNRVDLLSYESKPRNKREKYDRRAGKNLDGMNRQRDSSESRHILHEFCVFGSKLGSSDLPHRA